MKYSSNFDRDYNWYFKNKDTFTFSGSIPKKIQLGIKTAKECFYIFDSQGKLEACSEPKLLQQILLCKESVNFQIKEWAQDRAKGYLPKIEFENISHELGLLDWQIKAVEQQKNKYY